MKRVGGEEEFEPAARPGPDTRDMMRRQEGGLSALGVQGHVQAGGGLE